jgi:hypothetical protein
VKKGKQKEQMVREKEGLGNQEERDMEKKLEKEEGASFASVGEHCEEGIKYRDVSILMCRYEKCIIHFTSTGNGGSGEFVGKVTISVV